MVEDDFDMVWWDTKDSLGWAGEAEVGEGRGEGGAEVDDDLGWMSDSSYAEASLAGFSRGEESISAKRESRGEQMVPSSAVV